MFKGTKAVPAGEFSRVISEAGGRDNAFTSARLHRLLPDAAQIATAACAQARSRSHGESRAVARRVREGDPRRHGRAPLAHRRSPALARLRAAHRGGTESASVSQSRRRLDERSGEHARGRRACVLRSLVCAEQRDARDRRRRHAGRSLQARAAALRSDQAQDAPGAADHRRAGPAWTAAAHGEGAGRASVRADGLPRAEVARSREGLGAVCARDARRRARRQRSRASEPRAGSHRAHRVLGRCELRRRRPRSRHVLLERDAGAGQDRPGSRAGACGAKSSGSRKKA